MLQIGCHLSASKGYLHMGREAVSIGANTFQFFTIPVGYFMGGLLVDWLFEPFMAAQRTNSILTSLFGAGKGSGAAFFFCVLWIMGIGVCLLFRKDKAIWKLEADT